MRLLRAPPRLYHPDYGAFVLDPDGHNVEAAYHEATWSRDGSTRSPTEGGPFTA